MLDAVVVCAIAAAVLWTPGLLLLSAPKRSLPILDRLALAVPISIGAYFAFAIIVEVLGGGVAFVTVGLPVLIGSLLTHATWRRLRPGPRSPGGAMRPTIYALIAIIVVALAMWLISIGSTSTVPAFDDGANHGIFTRRLVDLQTLDPNVIVATDLADGASGVAYYPFGLHLVASFVATVARVDVALALHAVVVLVGALVGPLATFIFVRLLLYTFPFGKWTPAQTEWAAVVAAAVSVAAPAAIWANLTWGGLPTVTGVSMMPTILTAFLYVFQDRAMTWLLLGSVTYGAFVWHNPAVVTAALLCAGMMIAGWRHDRVREHRVVRRLGAAALVVALPLLPIVVQLVRGFRERVGGDSGEPVSWWTSLVRTVMDTTGGAGIFDDLDWRRFLATVVAVVALAYGIRLAAHREELRGLLVVSGGLVVIAWGCSAGIWILQRLGTPWYANGDRIMASLLPVYALLLGIGAVGIGLAIRDRKPSTRVLVAVLGSSYLVIMVIASMLWGLRAYREYSVVTAADRAMYTWLGATTQGQGRVLNDSHDGSMWMYDLGRANPVFGPKSDLWGVDVFASRRYLRDNIGHIDTDPQVRAIADELDVRYVAIGQRLIYQQGRQLDVDAIERSTSLREVYNSEGTRVYEIVPETP